MPDTSTEIALATTTLSSTAANITFSSISGSYTDLRIVLVGSTSATLNPRIQFNGDTGNNYSYTYLRGNGTSAASGTGTTTTGIITVGNFESGKVTMVTVDVFNYVGSTYKTVLSSYALDKNTTDGSSVVGRNVVSWRNTAAITSITLDTGGSTFAAGTTATLYGIA